MPVSVLQDILEWSKARPAWQRDALRRLILNGELTADDIQDLTRICKSGHGLAPACDVAPLTEEHVPADAAGADPVSLVSITHERGVNALAENQTLTFSSGLTLVYGNNGAGKTGYIRILKTACRARGQEAILGNVIAGEAPPAVAVAIQFKKTTDTAPRQWPGDGQSNLLSQISVFDTKCAGVYLTEKTDVAFRPFGLDLFDKLVRACKLVRTQLEQEQRELRQDAFTAFQATISTETAVGQFLRRISLLTKPEEVLRLGTLSDEETQQLAGWEQLLLDYKVNDPTKLIQQLTLRANRARKLVEHLIQVERALSDEALAKMFESRATGKRVSAQAKQLRDATFQGTTLPGTGSDDWRALWEAARAFSQSQAYPEQAFPVVNHDAKCVLCQQGLGDEASARLTHFEAFVVSSLERELKQLRDSYSRSKAVFVDLKLVPESAEEALKDLSLEHEDLVAGLRAAMGSNEARRLAVVEALAQDSELDANCPDLLTLSSQTQELAAQIDTRIAALRQDNHAEAIKRTETQVREMRARKALGEQQQVVLDELVRRGRHAAYGQCIEETQTRTITQQSTALTKAAVSDKLKQSFQEELARFNFRHLEVELREQGGEEGVFYHKLSFTRAHNIPLPTVVSEGEQRCLSIAAFFAELSTADDLSAIVFDDPISSLDYRWRRSVAQRLVEEAKTRQVIVFTHDIVFLLELREFAEKMEVAPLDQHLQHHLVKGAGVCTEELPWVARTVKQKIGRLNDLWQAADKVWRNGDQEKYQAEASRIYGLLREAWERASEEVLFNGVIERYRPNIKTLQMDPVADICAADCQALKDGMTKCSIWLPGHDQAAAANTPFPEPAELQADIKALDDWVVGIRERRKPKPRG